ncbi:MAG: nucleoside deaminase [Blautia sp.]
MNSMDKDKIFMKEAIRLSEMAVEHGNEPFGAVLVKDGEIVYTNENQIYTAAEPMFHAEIGLMRKFCHDTGIIDLSEYTLYSSCEPCFMCSGAMVWMKLGRLVYGASDKELCSLLGVEGSECSRIVFEKSGCKTQVTGGVLREESMEVLKKYFADHRKG